MKNQALDCSQTQGGSKKHISLGSLVRWLFGVSNMPELGLTTHIQQSASSLRKKRIYHVIC